MNCRLSLLFDLALTWISENNLLLISKMKVVAIPQVYLYDLSLREVMDAARFFSLVVSLFLLYMWLFSWCHRWVYAMITNCWVLITNCHLLGIVTYLILVIIGASLSEPHTSVTALAEVVCMYVCLGPYTVNFKWAYLNISWKPFCMRYTQPAVASVKGHCQSAVPVWRNPEERRRLKLTHGWQLRTMTDKGRLLTDSKNHAA